jgi:peptidyl-prolyl cis-trans isomerase B (cyclophilin B)
MANKKTPKQMPKKKSNTKNLIIGIIVIAIIAIAAYAVIRSPGSESANQNNPTPSPSATPTTSPATTPTSPSPTTSPSTTGTKVLLHTSSGDITIQLRTDKPITTANFINIVQKGWYDGTIFHRVIAGFMIQGGGISQTVSAIKDEIGTNNQNTKYTVAMAKTSNPNSATSEFFINAADNSGITYNDGTTFDGTYTVFGTVISGQNVVDAIAYTQVTTNAYGENSQPVHTITLIKASIVS